MATQTDKELSKYREQTRKFPRARSLKKKQRQPDPILRSRPKTQSGCEEKKVTVVPALIRASFR